MSAFWNGITNGFCTSLTYNLLSSFSPYRYGGIFGSYSSAPIAMPGGEFSIFQIPNFTLQAPKFDLSFTQQNYSLNNFSYNTVDFSSFSCNSSPYCFNYNFSWTTNPFSFYTQNITTNSISAPATTPKNKTIPSRTANELYEKWSKKDISKDAEFTLEFCEKVIQISKRIKCDPDDLMAIMYHESRFSPKAVNTVNKGKNVGLIQFGASTRKGFGFGEDAEASLNAMLRLSAMEQLDYVERFYAKARKNAHMGENDILTLDDMASIPFAPSIFTNEVLAERGSAPYESNPKLDTNGDGKITRTELGNKLRGIKA